MLMQCAQNAFFGGFSDILGVGRGSKFIMNKKADYGNTCVDSYIFEHKKIITTIIELQYGHYASKFKMAAKMSMFYCNDLPTVYNRLIGHFFLFFWMAILSYIGT